VSHHGMKAALAALPARFPDLLDRTALSLPIIGMSGTTTGQARGSGEPRVMNLPAFAPVLSRKRSQGARRAGGIFTPLSCHSGDPIDVCANGRLSSPYEYASVAPRPVEGPKP